MANGVTCHSSPGQPNHSRHTLTYPKPGRKKQNTLILDSNRFGNSTAPSQAFKAGAVLVKVIIHCELFALLISCFPSISCAHLTLHIHRYQLGFALQILAESPIIYNSAEMRRHHPYKRAEGKTPELNASKKEPLLQPWFSIPGMSCHRGVLLEQCWSHLVPQSVCSIKQWETKGSICWGGYEGTGQQDADAHSR